MSSPCQALGLRARLVALAGLLLLAGCASTRVGPPPDWEVDRQLVWWLERYEDATTPEDARDGRAADERAAAADAATAPDGAPADARDTDGATEAETEAEAERLRAEEQRRERRAKEPRLRVDAIRRGLGALAFRAPWHVELLVTNGLLALEVGDVPGATRWFDDALSLQPTNVRAVVARAGISVRGGNLDHARRLLDAAALLSPDEPALFDALAGVAFLSDDLVGAERFLGQAAALAEEPDAARAYHRGLLAEARGAYSTARVAYERALELDPTHAAAKRRARALDARR